jgi:hypothetical protein
MNGDPNERLDLSDYPGDEKPDDIDRWLAERLELGALTLDELPSSSWQGAGRVIEAMRERGWYIIFVDGKRRSTAWFSKAGGIVAKDGVANTAPEAIALAARAALESEDA